MANARIEWNGVLVPPEKLRQVRAALRKAAAHQAGILRRHGIDPPGDAGTFLAVMERAGLSAHFRHGGRVSVEDQVLEAADSVHPAVRAFRLHRRYSRLASEEWLTGCLLGGDGRLHPEHRQLGAATGRNSCRRPNLSGLPRLLRPMVEAPAGRALVELDYSQIEIGVAAAEYDDHDLIHAYNSGDVYAAMAQQIYRDELSDAEKSLAPIAFKAARPELRDQTKTLVLAILYGMQARTMGMRFGMSEEEATAARDRILDPYPVLKRRVDAAAAYAAVRGYSTTVSGLRRNRPDGRRVDLRLRNSLRNAPIQGSAADVFKRAVVLLDASFAHTTRQLVLPVHDSILIECNSHDVEATVSQARNLMALALRSYYPRLAPRIETQTAKVACWSKDGRSDSLEQFLRDPSLRFEDLGADRRRRPFLLHCPAPPRIARADGVASLRFALDTDLLEVMRHA